MKPKLGTFTLVLISLANMIGGIFLVPAAMASIGSIALWGWVWTFIGVMGLAYVFARLSRDYYHKGGILSQSGEVFGLSVEFILTLSYWFTCLVGNAATVITATAGIAYFFPNLNEPLYALMTNLFVLWLCIWVVYRGLYFAALVEVVVAIVMIAAIIFVICIGLPSFKMMQLTEHYHIIEGQSVWVAVAAGAALCVWQFMGIETASIMSSTAKNPTKTIPRTMIWSVVLATLLCGISSMVVMGSLPYGDLLHSNAPYAELVTQRLGISTGYLFNLIVNMVILLSLIGWFMVQSYPPKIAAEKGLFPKFFAKENKQGIPSTSLILGGVIMSIMIIAVQSSGTLTAQFHELENFSVFNTLLPYLFACFALFILRVKKMLFKSSFWVELIFTVIAVLYIVFIAVGLSWLSWVYGVVFCLVAIGLALAQKSMRSKTN